MKTTEGYWHQIEKDAPEFASMVFSYEALENEGAGGGIRLVMPFRRITDRSGALDVGTLTMDVTAIRPDVWRVHVWHYEGWKTAEPHFAICGDPQGASVAETEKEITVKSGRMGLSIRKDDFRIAFTADGRELTSIGFRNLAYIRAGRAPITRLPGRDYLTESYDPYLKAELSLAPGECVYGLGERFTPYVKNGQSVDMWNEDGGTSSQVAYKNIPFYVTSQHYGVLVESSREVSFEVGSEKVENVGFSVPGEEMTFDVLYADTMKQLMVLYTDLTGKPALPPAWSFGLWLSTSFTTNYDEATTSSFIQGMADRDIPLSVFHFDCFWMKALHWSEFEWDSETFPDVEGMLKRYHERGLHICVWINPYIAQGTKFFREGLENGYFVMRADGKGPKQLDSWQPGMALVDFTNPDAVTWYTGKLRTLLDMGVDCFKTDFGERIPVDVVYHDGSDPMAMHNYYTFLYNQAVFNLLKQVRGEGEACLFARSATVGGQMFPVHWGGDCSASYASMAETLRGGLSFAMSGFSFWSHDISGFENTADPDVYKRWLQFGLLSSHSRLHGSKSYRVPWLFGEEAVDVCRRFTKLKLHLMPYLYAGALASHHTGVPLMRPMALEFDASPEVRYLDMQYMLGERLLVAPVFNKEGRADYYLPEEGGLWTSLLDGSTQGSGWHHDTYDFMSLPLMVRPNSLLPIGSCDDRADYDYAKDAEIRAYELQDGVMAVCEVPYREAGGSSCQEGAADADAGWRTFSVKALRQGDQVTFTADRLSEGMTIRLMNVSKAEALSGCALAVVDGNAPEGGVVIRPEEREFTVKLLS